MANNGLKNANELLSVSISTTEVLSNVSKYNGNVSLKIKLLSTLGAFKTNIILYFDLYNNNNIGLGKGVTFNYYNKIIYNSNDNLYTLTTYDGLDYVFSHKTTNEYYNDELNQYIYRDALDNFRFLDGFGNVFNYNTDSNLYPHILSFINSQYYLVFNTTNNMLSSINVHSGQRIISTINFTYSNGLLNKISCTKPNNEYLFTYNNSNYITSIIGRKTNAISNFLNVSYGITSSLLEVFDNITNKRCQVSYYYDSSINYYDVYTIQEDYYIDNLSIDSSIITIESYELYTKLYNGHGYIMYLYYDDNKKIIEYTVDDNYNVNKLLYNNYNRQIGVYNNISVCLSSVTYNNLIPNGYFENSGHLSGWEIQFASNYYFVYDVNRPLSNAIGPYYLYIQNGNNNCTLKTILNLKGTELDSYFLLFWLKLVSAGSTCDNDIVINIKYKSKVWGIEETVFEDTKYVPHKEEIDNTWYPYLFEVTSEKCFESLEIKFTFLSSNVKYGIDGILLTNSKIKKLSPYYNYQNKEKDEVTDKVTSYIYNCHDEIYLRDILGRVIDEKGIVTDYTYDDNLQNIIEENNSYITISKEYDSSEKNNLVQETIISNQNRLIKRYYYSYSKDFITRTIDYDNSVNEYNNNEQRGLVIEHVYPNGNSLFSSYNDCDLVTSNTIDYSLGTTSLSYQYDLQFNLSSINKQNTNLFSFMYDNKKLLSITLNGSQILESYDYLGQYPYSISEIKKGTNGDRIKYIYDSYGNLTQVKYKLKGENSYHTKYEFIYDNASKNKIIETIVYKNTNSIYKNYEYDILNNIRLINDSVNNDYLINYLYDNKNIVALNSTILSNKRYDVLPVDNNLIFTLKRDLKISSLYQVDNNRLKYYCFFDNDLTPYNSLRAITSVTKASDSSGVTKLIVTSSGASITPIEENGNYYLPLSQNNKLEYNVPCSYLDQNKLYYFSIGFLFIPTSLSDINTLFSIYDSTGFSRLVCIKTPNDELKLELYDDTNDFVMIESLHKKVTLNTINYFGISVSINTTDHILKVKCVLNNEKYNFDDLSITNTVIKFNHFRIGSFKDTTLSPSSFKLYSLMFMPLLDDNVLSLSQLIKNYHLLKDIYESKATSVNIDNVITNSSYFSDSVTSLTDYIPLQYSFTSINNTKPLFINKRYDETFLRNRYFKYLNSVNSYMLKMDGINFVYDLNLNYTFTIGMNIIFSNIYNTDYIYTFKCENSYASLLIKDYILYLDINNNLISTNIQVSVNTLYFISIGFDCIYSGDSMPTDNYKIRVKCNNSIYNCPVSESIPYFNNPILIIGSKKINEEVDHFIDGYISNLCYNNTYMSESNIDLLIQDLTSFKTITCSDKINRVNKKEIVSNALNITTDYSYRQVLDDDYTLKDTLDIENEIIKVNNSEIYRKTYEYGTGTNQGKIVKTKENTTTKNMYDYNRQSFLEAAYYLDLQKYEEFTFNSNGNIQNRTVRNTIDGGIYDDIDYYYDTAWPDRLVRVKNKKIVYDTDSIGNPIQYGVFSGSTFVSGITYSWRGSKLVGLTDTTKNISITYDYDETGNRINKDVTNTSTSTTISHKYYYENNRLVTESISGDIRLEYLYDNNSIVGFIYKENNTTNKYYFIKNLFGDVIKIVDITGSIVVEYVYSSYGEVYSVTGSLSSTIGLINPIRYRSYYYDSETAYYYLKTRFYDPYICRFINSDNIRYLEKYNPLNISLFRYCNNNPIMGVDPEGTFWQTIYDYGNTALGLIDIYSKITALGALGIAIANGRWSDIVEDYNNGCLNIFNQDEAIAMQSKVLSFYKGSTVVRLTAGGTGCGIIGTIFLSKDLQIEDLKHEFGHNVQERILGLFPYVTNIAIPSLAYYLYDKNSNNSTKKDYYSTPWERTADFFGGVNRNDYKTGSLLWGIVENILGPTAIPLYFIWGY